MQVPRSRAAQDIRNRWRDLPAERQQEELDEEDGLGAEAGDDFPDGAEDGYGYEEPDDDPVLGRQFWALLGGRWRKVTGLSSDGRVSVVVGRDGRRHNVQTSRLRGALPDDVGSVAVSEDSAARGAARRRALKHI